MPLALLLTGLGVWGCAQLEPLREPPPLARDDPAAGIRTRDQALARLGPPEEVRASDVGTVLVYRRLAVAEANPNRYFLGGSTRFDRFERLFLYVDETGQIVRWATAPE